MMSGLLLVLLSACDLGGQPPVYTGTIEVTEVEVASTVGGRLVEVRAEEGAEVAPGEVLFRVDTARMDKERALREAGIGQARAAEQAARAQVRAANAQVATLTRELERVAALEKAGVGTDQQRSQLSGQLEVARAQAAAAREMVGQATAAVAQAEAGLAVADTLLAEASVSAVTSGVVLTRHREPGEVVGPGTSVLTVGDLAHPRLRIYAPLVTVERLAIGDEVRVRLDTATATGHVARIATEAEFTPREILTPEERVKRVFAVDIALEPGPGVHPGMPAEAVLPEA